MGANIEQFPQYRWVQGYTLAFFWIVRKKKFRMKLALLDGSNIIRFIVAKLDEGAYNIPGTLDKIIRSKWSSLSYQHRRKLFGNVAIGYAFFNAILSVCCQGMVQNRGQRYEP
jgi:hypothetical protein